MSSNIQVIKVQSLPGGYPELGFHLNHPSVQLGDRYKQVKI
jgi:hypothetical protein